jgi:hypothetical protein
MSTTGSGFLFNASSILNAKGVVTSDVNSKVWCLALEGVDISAALAASSTRFLLIAKSRLYLACSLAESLPTLTVLEEENEEEDEEEDEEEEKA